MDRRQVILTASALAATAADANGARSQAAKLVAATGGVDAWRAARGLEIRATHDEAQLTTP